MTDQIQIVSSEISKAVRDLRERGVPEAVIWMAISRLLDRELAPLPEEQQKEIRRMVLDGAEET